MNRDVPFSRRAGRVLKMDIYRGSGGDQPRPGLVFLHGGAWVLGDKREQGLPLCNHLATLGWVCANANYRLSPGATYPDHVVDAKDAVTWLILIKEELGETSVAYTVVNEAGASVYSTSPLGRGPAGRSGWRPAPV